MAFQKYKLIACLSSLLASATLLKAQDTTQPSISPRAQQLLAQVRDAYSSLKALQISGTMEGHFDIDGEKKDVAGQFTGLFSGGKFRHDMKDDAAAGNTGDKVYLFKASANSYLMLDAPQTANLTTIDPNVADVVRQQDLSLALALAPDAAAELGTDAISIDRVDDAPASDSDLLPTLRVSKAEIDMTLSFDPQTHLLRRETLDYIKQAKKRGAVDVRKDLVTVDFSASTPPSLDASQFAWDAPPGAHAMQVVVAEGQRCPTFVLPSLTGPAVNTEGLKGTVYVLDFWASYCAPCLASLPHLDELNRDPAIAGATILSINELDVKSRVEKIVTDKKLMLPVLLDTDGKVGLLFGTDSLPVTVLVNKNGRIRKIYRIIGIEDDLKREVQAALAEK